MTTARQWLALTIAFLLVLIGTTLLLPIPWLDDRTVIQELTETPEKTFHLVTVEYEGEAEGKEIEAYRWDPGFITVNQGTRSTWFCMESTEGNTASPQGVRHQRRCPKRENSPGLLRGRQAGDIPADLPRPCDRRHQRSDDCLHHGAGRKLTRVSPSSSRAIAVCPVAIRFSDRCQRGGNFFPFLYASFIFECYIHLKTTIPRKRG